MVVYKAVRYFIERENLMFSDGVFLVDLEKSDSVQAMTHKFSSDLNLLSPN